MKKIRTIKDLDLLEIRPRLRVGDEPTMVSVTNTGRHWRQPVRITAVGAYITARAIPPPGDPLTFDQMYPLKFSCSTLHRIRHDGTVDTSTWLTKDEKI